jgi:hypothetical protein
VRPPPSRARVVACLLSCVLHHQDVEAIIGDLEEEYAWRARAGYRPDWWYWVQVMRSLPSLLWLPIQRGGWPSTVGVAFAACALQAGIEIAAGVTAHRLSPPDAQWPAILTLGVTLPSLTLVSYQANRIRPGAATALAAIGVLAVGAQLILATATGHGLLPGTVAALVVVPATVLTAGSWGLRARHR